MEKILSQPTNGSLVLLPILYMVWSDTTIDASEHQAFQSFFKAVDWLSEEDRKYLTAKLDPNSPPSREELEMWWKTNSIAYSHIKELVINLDNGPNSSSRRTQFIRRMTEFSDKTGLRIRLVYYPPYHSKYNPIERCWGILEEHWNGELLDSISKAINWASTMTWKGINPVVKLVEKLYKKGIRLTKKEMKPYENRIQRSNTLPKWDVLIQSGSG